MMISVRKLSPNTNLDCQELIDYLGMGLLWVHYILQLADLSRDIPIVDQLYHADTFSLSPL